MKMLFSFCMFLFFFDNCFCNCVFMVLGGVLCDIVFCFCCGCSCGDEDEGFFVGDMLVIFFFGFWGFLSLKGIGI